VFGSDGLTLASTASLDNQRRRKLERVRFRVKPIEKDAVLMKSLFELYEISFSARYSGEADVRLSGGCGKAPTMERSI
jgi:hypothetical protein